jgi:MoxR-like ATPase
MTTMTEEVTMSTDGASAAAPSAAPSAVSAADTMRDVRDEMKQVLVERDAEIELLILSLIARTHLLLIGSGGVAKSMVAREMHSRIDGASKFEILLRKNLDIEQLVGPISLVGLQNDSFRHVTSGRIVESNIALLDEIFKANPVVLNALLGILNERVFHNDGQVEHVPLWSAIGASNELPTEPELAAFRDRFAAAKVVEGVKTDDGFKSILRGQVARNAGISASAVPTTVTKDQMLALQAAARTVVVPEDVLNDLAQMKRAAEADHNLVVSARRYGEGVKLCQAQAVLNGRTMVTSDDLTLFQHLLWTDVEDIPKAYEVTLEFAGKVAQEANKLRLAFDPFKGEITAIHDEIKQNNGAISQESTNKLTGIAVNLRTVLQKVESAIADAQSSGRDTSELDSLLGEVKDARRVIREEIM